MSVVPDESRAVRRRALRVAVQLAVSAALTAVLWRMSGGGAVAERLAAADRLWVAAGLLCATLAIAAAALRWRYTARSIGADLGVERSVREFYLASFLNQILPGGVAGDVVRAWRHGRRAADDAGGGMGPAVRAVLIERVANQAVVSILMLGSLCLWPWLPDGGPGARVWLPLVGAAALVGGTLGAVAILARIRGGTVIERFLRDSRQALLTRGRLPAQLGLGLLVTGTCVAMFYCAARAVGAPLSLFHLLALVPGALFAMSLPVSIGGWGLREASAVALWTMAGLPAGEAMASSVLYGLLALIGALPGAVVLALDR
jgi:uncharacterized membrane protein YbhN (UPF0104 family)